MTWSSKKLRSIIGALLFVLLIGVQTISIAHAYKHDSVSFGDTACATCISINQLAAAAIDTGPVTSCTTFAPLFCGLACGIAAGKEAELPNQRGPPHWS